MRQRGVRRAARAGRVPHCGQTGKVRLNLRHDSCPGREVQSVHSEICIRETELPSVIPKRNETDAHRTCWGGRPVQFQLGGWRSSWRGAADSCDQSPWVWKRTGAWSVGIFRSPAFYMITFHKVNKKMLVSALVKLLICSLRFLTLTLH